MVPAASRCSSFSLLNRRGISSGQRGEEIGKGNKKKRTGRRIVKQGREEAEREMGLGASLFGGDCPMKQQKLRRKEGSL